MEHDSAQEKKVCGCLTAFLSSSSDFAVPKETVKLPILAKVYSPLLVYCEEDTELYRSKVLINDMEYELANSVVNLRTPYTQIFWMVGVIDFILMLIYNVVYRVVLIYKKYRKMD